MPHSIIRIADVILADALTELHYQFNMGEALPIRGYAGNVATGQVEVTTLRHHMEKSWHGEGWHGIDAHFPDVRAESDGKNTLKRCEI